MQRGTLVKVTENTLAGTCLPSWVGRVQQISGTVLVVSNGKRQSYVSLGEVEEIGEMLPVR